MQINHVNLVVADIGRSVAFYGGLLGMRTTFDARLHGAWFEAVTGLPGAEARCVFLETPVPGCRIELLQFTSRAGAAVEANRSPATPGLRHLAFEVTDVAALYERLSAAGVSFVAPPVRVPFPVAGGLTKRMCYLHDPDGVLVEVADYVSLEEAGSKQ